MIRVFVLLATVGLLPLPIVAEVPDMILVDSEVFSASVLEVLSGDAIRVKRDGDVYLVVLRGIDAPEPDQPYADEAKAHLLKLLKGKEVRLTATPAPHTNERHVLMATVHLRDKDVSQEMLRRGLAWYCPPPGGDHELSRVEASAQESRSGLWSLDDPTPPWTARDVDNCSENRHAA